MKKIIYCSTVVLGATGLLGVLTRIGSHIWENPTPIWSVFWEYHRSKILCLVFFRCNIQVWRCVKADRLPSSSRYFPFADGKISKRQKKIQHFGRKVICLYSIMENLVHIAVNPVYMIISYIYISLIRENAMYQCNYICWDILCQTHITKTLQSLPHVCVCVCGDRGPF